MIWIRADGPSARASQPYDDLYMRYPEISV